MNFFMPLKGVEAPEHFPAMLTLQAEAIKSQEQKKLQLHRHTSEVMGVVLATGLEHLDNTDTDISQRIPRFATFLLNILGDPMPDNRLSTAPIMLGFAEDKELYFRYDQPLPAYRKKITPKGTLARHSFWEMDPSQHSQGRFYSYERGIHNDGEEPTFVRGYVSSMTDEAPNSWTLTADQTYQTLRAMIQAATHKRNQYLHSPDTVALRNPSIAEVLDTPRVNFNEAYSKKLTHELIPSWLKEL